MIPALRALRLFRLIRVAVVGARVIDQSDSILKRSNTKYAMMVAALIVLLAAVMVWHVEHDNPQSSIHSITDALWWAVTTVTTVGYGDKYPQSPEGKAVAIGLMILGIAIFGLVSATLASYFIESDTNEEYEEMRTQLARVEAKLDALLADKRNKVAIDPAVHRSLSSRWSCQSTACSGVGADPGPKLRPSATPMGRDRCIRAEAHRAGQMPAPFRPSSQAQPHLPPRSVPAML
jgi:voltage-gated potassium channel